ncbi:hypothetical protein NE237_028631 [Protea cynaroides]|uniref:Late embryogenesis abundant protein LEA-2 subgroup domain-containing protein n=1 Tax=Protea cynaroides TaxID=273540 RepID=A0A9Q0JT28_9MAGN|nr:hypothetical protein NE237_028631 [Protea cynaroides]
MVEEEQSRRVSLPWQRINSLREEDAQWKSAGKLRWRRCIQCCGCLSALMLIFGIILLILVFTVFRIKDVAISLNSVTFEKMSISNPPAPRGGFPFNQTPLTSPSVNMTMIADLTIKNPNIASFKYNNATTNLYYDGYHIGEALNPAGNARARKTFHMNLTVEISIKPDSSSFVQVYQLSDDLNFGSLKIDTYTWIDGRVNALNIFKRYIIVKMNCTMMVNMTSSSIEYLNCREAINGL